MQQPSSLDAGARRWEFERLLVDGRWESDVRVAVGGRGEIEALEVGGPPNRGHRRSPAGRGGECERIAGWTVPGVPNVHGHAAQRALAGLAEGRGPRSFWRWREALYGFLARMTPDDLEAIAAQLYLELLKGGFTAVGEFHYLHHAPDGSPYDDDAEMGRRVLAAARRAGIGLVHMPALYQVAGFGGEPLAGTQRRFRLNPEGALRMHQALAADFAPPGAELGWAIHSLRAAPPDTIGEVVDIVGEPAGGRAGPVVHIHVAEQEREAEECRALRGAGPVGWLLDNVAVDRRWCLVHATQASRRELAEVARLSAVVGLCPVTEANLGDGLFPLADFVRAGGGFGIGTDSHVSRSAVEELRMLEYGQRLITRSRSPIRTEPPEGLPTARGDGKATGRATGGGALAGGGGALLALAWKHGCRALGWKGGRVARGRRADLVVLDAEHPALVGRGGGQVLDSWIFSGTDNPVRDVMVGGRWVVREGRHAREEEIGRRYAATVRRLGEGG